MKIYISGQITGIPINEARKAFKRVEIELRERGFNPINPMNNGLDVEDSWEAHLRADIKKMMDCEAIYLLPNYKQSKGALLELYIAEQLGFKVIEDTYLCPICTGIYSELDITSTRCIHCDKRVCVYCVEHKNKNNTCDRCEENAIHADLHACCEAK